MLPIGSSTRRLLNQSTHSRVRVLHRFEGAPGATAMDNPGLVKAVAGGDQGGPLLRCGMRERCGNLPTPRDTTMISTR